WMDFPKDQPYRPDDEDEVLDINLRQDPAFRRPMRYDTKKPGPTYFFHEPDSSETSNENEQNARRVMLRQQKLRAGARYGVEQDVDQEDAVLDHLKEVAVRGPPRLSGPYTDRWVRSAIPALPGPFQTLRRARKQLPHCRR
ncbi:hypothetical protein HPB47_009794, partial [Ixodes persulcatus]